MLKSIIIVDDYAYINGGAASVAIRSAIYLATHTGYDVYYFSAVGDVCTELRNSRIKEIICLNQFDILHNPNKFHAFLHGIWNRASKRIFGDFLSKFDAETTIVHIHTWTKALSPSIFSVLHKKKFHTVVTLHDYFINCPNGGYFNYRKSRACELSPLSFECIMSNCDSRHYYYKLWRVLRQTVQNRYLLNGKNFSFIYISDFSKKQIQKRLPALKNLSFVPNPVDFSERRRFTPENNDVYLYVGRLSEEKGIRIFCEVIASLKRNAVVVGDGPLRKELTERYSQNDEIIFTGWLAKDRIRTYLKKTKYLIFPSLWYETLGLTVLEAMAYGIPCIVSDMTAAASLIKDGIDGIIYESGNKDSLKEIIIKTDDKKLIKNLSCNAYRNFDENLYSVENHIDVLIQTYKNIINSNNKFQ